MKITLAAEFRRFDQERRTGKAFDKDGNVIEGKIREYDSRVLRLEIEGEGVIARLWEDQQISIPDTLKKGDMVQIQISGFQTVKEATYVHVVGLSVNGKK